MKIISVPAIKVLPTVDNTHIESLMSTTVWDATWDGLRLPIGREIKGLVMDSVLRELR